MPNQRLEVVVLAAGQGSRMRSSLPKVLHPLAGRPLLAHVLDVARALEPKQLHVVYGHGGESVPATLANYHVNWVLQREQLGTGHAVAQALPQVDEGSRLLLLYGDVPLIGVETLQRLLIESEGGVGLLTVELADPTGYGRIVRSPEGRVAGIVEERDADPTTLAIREINTGIMALDPKPLANWLQQMDSENSQGEYYLTDLVAMAVTDGVPISSVSATDSCEVMGVNDRVQLGHLERHYQKKQAELLMRQGVTVCDPMRLDIRGTLSAGRDVTLDVGVVLEGEVILGDGVSVGANSILRDVTVGPGTIIKPMSIIEEAAIAGECTIGPYARIRPGTELAAGARIGNFVEIKKSRVGENSKVNHLSYIGDTKMGSGVNIGAGVITCNYDGKDKHPTTIGDRAFIGSDCQLVAPVSIGDDATIGAGSTITRNAPPGELSISRNKQRSIKEWQREKK